MSLADVQITLARHALIAHLTGEIDMSNAEDMGATVIGATPNEVSGVVLDLSGVEYLDSPPESAVHDALRLSGAERPGKIAETVDAALSTIERPSPAEA